MSRPVAPRVFSSFPLAAAFRTVVVMGLAGTAGACATTSKGGGAQPPSAPVQLEMEPIKIEASQGPAGVEVASYDAQDLFEQAGAALSQKRPDDASKLYERLLESFPESTYARSALYNLGLAYQDAKNWAQAVETFKAFCERHGAHPDAKDAQFQLGASYAELVNWPASAEVFSRILERRDLTADDRIEAMARRGFAQLSLSDLDTAERTFRGAIAYRDQIATQERLGTDFYVAFTLYHLGQVTHGRFRQVALRLPETQMDRDLEDKAKLLLDAQRRYIETIRVGHPGWASAAGYQVGALYEELYDAFLRAPVPAGLDAEGRSLYTEELQKKVKVLLEKSLRWHRENLRMMERVGAASEWTEKTKLSYAKLLKLLDPNAAAGGDVPIAPATAPAQPAPPSRAPGSAPSEADPTLPRQIL